MFKRMIDFFKNSERRLENIGIFMGKHRIIKTKRQMKQKGFFGSLFSFNPSIFSGTKNVANLNRKRRRFKSHISGFEADREAIENDFRMIGQDISNVFEKIKQPPFENKGY